MATGAKRGGDMVLGGRHLAGMFVVLVVLFGVVFTLGYVLGRSHGGAPLGAAAGSVAHPADEVAAAKPAASGGASADVKTPPPAPDWDFYHSAEPSNPAERLAPQPKPVAEKTPAAVTTPAVKPFPSRSAAKPAPSASSSGLNAPLIARGSTVLQVAALDRASDALALAQALQQKKFPAFVLNPTTDHFYRVQVGPYADAQSANAARQRLESQGFKSIVKR
jgi:cell division septation protein DedD